MKKTNRKPFCYGIAGGLMAAVLLAGQMSVLAEEAVALDNLTAGASLYLENDGTSGESETAENTISDIEGVDLTAGAATTVEAAGENADSVVLEQSTLVMANVNDAVNVRIEPDEEAETVGKLFKDCGGEILDSAEGWTKIKSGNLEGWVKNDYLLFEKEAEALRNEVGTLKATVETDALRVRKEADENAGVYKLVKQGDTLEAVEQQDEWVAVELDDDTIGYLAADYVSVEFSVDTGKTSKEIADEERAKELAKLSQTQEAVPTSVSDVTLLAALIQCEAGTQSYEGKLAVGAVVMNRVRSGAYPNTILGVITAPGQFPPATDGKVSAVVARGPSASCMEAAQAAVDGATNVGTATHFGAVGKANGVVIGGHVFY